MMTIDSLRYLLEKAIQHRRYLHEHPEIGFDLPGTYDYVSSQLSALSIPVIGPIGHYSLIGVIENGNGPVMGLRADMDALPIEENNPSIPFCSKNKGKMHACGHDAHTAIVLTVAEYLQTHKELWKGTVKLIFQEAEEGPDPGGAHYVVASGHIDDVEVFYGLHCSPELPVGIYGIKEGPMLASADTLSLTINGKGAHAAYPHLGINPVSIQADIITQINQIIPTKIDKNELSVITISQVHSGTTHNVIPQTAYMQGTIRSFNPRIRKQLHDEIVSVIERITKQYQATYELTYQWGYDALINQPKPTQHIIDTIHRMLGVDHCKILEKPSMGAEDFSKYINYKTGAFVWLGTYGGSETSYGLHHPLFAIDEEALLYGIGLMINIVCP